MKIVQSKGEMMLRRDFLKYTSAVAAMVLIPVESMAAEYTGPLWIFVQAIGGWDPTSFCDPKGYLSSELDENNRVSNSAMNKSYAKTEIVANAKGVKYAPLSGSDGIDNYEFSEFFENNADDLLVINGIDTQTNGHDSGRRYMMSGRLSEGYPALSALIAGINMPASPLAFVTAGGYDETDGVVAGTRLGNLNAINELAFVNSEGIANNDRYVPYSEGDTITYKHPSVLERIKKARNERTKRLISKQKLASVEALAKQYNLAHTGSNELVKLVEFLPDDLDTHTYRRNNVFGQGRFAMAGYKAGLTSSVNIQTGGFDTHSNNDNGQRDSLAKLLKGVELLQEEAVAQGIADRVIFVIGSEFGRTPGYNDGDGKDHWSVSSMMFMGAGIRGGRVIGSTTSRHSAEKVNVSTLAKDNSGIKITYAHVNKALRKLAGIENDELITQYYPLTSVEELDLFS